MKPQGILLFTISSTLLKASKITLPESSTMSVSQNSGCGRPWPYNTTTTISHLTSNNPDLVLLIGDVTYTNLDHTQMELALTTILAHFQTL
ncbi:unnamed protein product [Malus baccata var. baccata]